MNFGGSSSLSIYTGGLISNNITSGSGMAVNTTLTAAGYGLQVFPIINSASGYPTIYGIYNHASGFSSGAYATNYFGSEVDIQQSGTYNDIYHGINILFNGSNANARRTAFYSSAGNILLGVDPSGGSYTLGFNVDDVLAIGVGTAPTAAIAAGQLFAANLNGSNTAGFQFMNQATTTVYTMTGTSGTTAVSTGAATVLMGSANPGTNAGWLTMLGPLGALIYMPYWLTPTP